MAVRSPRIGSATDLPLLSLTQEYDSPLNQRQYLVVNRLLDGFEAKFDTMTYEKLAKCWHDTALRDIAALVERGILSAQSGRWAQRKLLDCQGKR